MYSTEYDVDSITCPKSEHSKIDDIEKLIRNPGRVTGTKNVYTNFYDVYTNETLSTFVVKVPKIDPAGIKFITAFMPDRKNNQYTNHEEDIIDLFNPDIITDANYAYSGNNMMYFANNDRENVYTQKVYLVKEELDTIRLNTERSTCIDNKYNSILESLSVKYKGCCHYYVDLMPYIKNEMIKWVYSKYQILNTLNSDDKEYNDKVEINNFINRLKLNITQIQVFPQNIRIGFHARIENYDWAQGLLDEMDLHKLEINELASFFIKVLPDEPMVGRVFDRRVGYFTIDKRIIDPNSLEDNVKLITRLRIPEARDHIYKIYVDPAIPAKYYGNLRDMIAKYNREFFYINGFNPFKVVTIEEIDFPEDFDRNDLRYPVISVTQNTNTGYWGIANTLVDGRSGEIMWFRMMINTDITTQQTRMAIDYRGRSTTFNQLTTYSTDKLKKAFNVQSKFIKKLKKNNIMPCCMLRDNVTVLPSSTEYKLLLQSVLTHEMGHCLGLRHNFAGSIQGNTAQASSSVMDYHAITQGWIGTSTPNAAPKITPGVYDKYAITYGYIMLAGEVTGVKHSSLDGLAAGYTLEQADSLTEADFLNNPLNPIFVTDDVIDMDPRGSLYDHGDQFEWTTVERQQFETARLKLLDDVKNRVISYDLYTRLLLSAYMRLIRGGFEVMSKYFGGFIYDLNKLGNRTTTRLECCKALQYVLKYTGDYSPDDFNSVDPQFADNIQNFFFYPTAEELDYLRSQPESSYDVRPFRLERFQSNLGYVVLDKLLGLTDLDKVNRLNDTNRIANMKGEQYVPLNIFSLATHMSIPDFLGTIAFSPGCCVCDESVPPRLPKGTPWLHYTYVYYYQSEFTDITIVPFSGLYDEENLIPPFYPIAPLPGQAILPVPTPIPYTSPGYFPEVAIFATQGANQTGFSRVNSEQYLRMLREMTNVKMTKRVQFMTLLLSFVNDISSDRTQIREYSDFINAIKDVAQTIASLYTPGTTDFAGSIYASATQPDYNISQNILNHMLSIYNIAVEIVNTIDSKIGSPIVNGNIGIFNKNSKTMLRGILAKIKNSSGLKVSVPKVVPAPKLGSMSATIKKVAINSKK